MVGEVGQIVNSKINERNNLQHGRSGKGGTGDSRGNSLHNAGMSSAVILPAGTTGLVFDCDGTLADTMPLHYLAWKEALGEHGVDFPEAMFYEMAGIPTVRIIELLNERHGYAMPVMETFERKEALYLKLLPKVKAIGEVTAFVDAYRGRLPLAVATGGTRAIVEKTLGAIGMQDCFDAIVTADDVKHGKPAPDIFLESARRLGQPAERCVAFEDAELGIQSARAAGMYVIDIRPLRKP